MREAGLKKYNHVPFLGVINLVSRNELFFNIKKQTRHDRQRIHYKHTQSSVRRHFLLSSGGGDINNFVQIIMEDLIDYLPKAEDEETIFWAAKYLVEDKWPALGEAAKAFAGYCNQQGIKKERGSYNRFSGASPPGHH
eukprot:gene14126-576_t